MKGKFITFEGGEGVGKTTQVGMLADYFRKSGFGVCVTREPGGDEIGEKIRGVLKSSTRSMDPLCETLLLFAARRDHYVKVIAPALNRGDIVICDRFYDSSLVYQGILKQVPFENILTLKRMTIEELEPDLTIILDINPEESMNRLITRNLIPDEYDLMEKEKHNIIRKGFQKIADIFSFRCALIDASRSEKKVFSHVMKAVDKFLVL